VGLMDRPAYYALSRRRPPALPCVEASPTVWLLTFLLIIALLYTLYLGRALVIPIVLAVMLYLVLAPPVLWLRRRGVPRALAVLVVLGSLAGAVAAGAYALSEPATAWLNQAPTALRQVQAKLRVPGGPLADLERASKTVDAIGNGNDPGVQEVVVRDGSWRTSLAAGTGQVVGSILAILVLAAFLLATGGRIGRDLAGLLAGFGNRRRALRIATEIRREISYYLLTITVINTGLGAAAALGLWLVGMPNPVLWGTVCGLLNFVPFLGPTLCIGLVTFAALTAFDQPLAAMVPGLVILGLNVLESQIITPATVAMRLSLSPVIVFLSFMLWGWLWGVPGALLAVPVLAAFKIICDHVPHLAALGRVLGESRIDPVELQARLPR
jgi:predicted PurR-regulated permease PerM